MINIDKQGTQAELAELVGVSQQAISKALGKRWIHEGDTLRQWLLDYCENLRGQAAGRSGDAQARLTDARTREATVSAQLKEVQFLEACGRLVPVSEIEPLLEHWVIMAQAEINAAVNKLVADIQGQHNVKIDQSLIDGHLLSAYKMIAAHPGKQNAHAIPGEAS